MSGNVALPCGDLPLTKILGPNSRKCPCMTRRVVPPAVLLTLSRAFLGEGGGALYGEGYCMEPTCTEGVPVWCTALQEGGHCMESHFMVLTVQMGSMCGAPSYSALLYRGGSRRAHHCMEGGHCMVPHYVGSPCKEPHPPLL